LGTRLPPAWDVEDVGAIRAFGVVLAGIANPRHAIIGLRAWGSSVLPKPTPLPITTAALWGGRGARRFFLTNRWREVVLSRLSVADGCLQLSKLCA
jgi:hypothetical protein